MFVKLSASDKVIIIVFNSAEFRLFEENGKKKTYRLITNF